MKPRGNPSIWRLAEWLCNNVVRLGCESSNAYRWDELSTSGRKEFYDKALDLYRRTGMVSTLGLL